MKKTLILCIVLCLLLPCLVSCRSNEIRLIEFEITAFYPWLEDIDTTSVVRVEKTHSYYASEPDIAVRNYYSTDVEVIDEFIEWFKEYKIYPVFPEIIKSGGGSNKYTFTFADGSTKEIKTRSAFYDIINPSECKAEMDDFYRFNVSSESYSIYTYGDDEEPIKIIENGASKLSFVRCDPEQIPDVEPTHYIIASFGKVYFYSESICYIESEYDGDFMNGYYELYNQSLSGLME